MTTPSYARDYDRVVRKYAADHDTLGLLLSGLSDADRWGGPAADHTRRGATADALDENDRPEEAALLRDPARHVLVDAGRVRPGRFTLDHLRTALHAVHDHAFTGYTPTPGTNGSYVDGTAIHWADEIRRGEFGRYPTAAVFVGSPTGGEFRMAHATDVRAVAAAEADRSARRELRGVRRHGVHPRLGRPFWAEHSRLVRAAATAPVEEPA